MRLHYHPLSTYSRKALLGIRLRDDAVELRELNPFAGDLKRADYVAMSPFGKMPVLETDEGPLFESTSILEYLEERGPRRLLPPGVERLARHHDRLGDLYLLTPIGKYFWDKSEAIRATTEATMAIAWQLWARALADGRPYVCGNEITLGDLGAAIAAHYAVTEGLSLPDDITAYVARLEQHPAFAESRAAAQPFVEATRARREKKEPSPQ